MPSETTHLADVLFVVLPRGQSLASLQRAGRLDRLWLLPSHLASAYTRTVIVTADADASMCSENDTCTIDTAEEQRIADTLGCDTLHVNDESINTIDVEQFAAGCEAGTVRTIGFSSGDVACALVGALESHLHHVVMVASGDVLWSRARADNFGTDSNEAAVAAMIESAVCTQADAVIGSCDAMVGNLAWRYHVPVEATYVIPSALPADLPVITAAARQADLLVCVGVMAETDRVDLVIESFAQFIEMGDRNTRLVVIGDGPMTERYKAFAEERCEGKVEFVADTTDAARIELVSRAAVVVSATTDAQSLPYILEAMATGAALVITNGKGVCQRVQHGVTGLAMPSEPDAIARAIEGLIEDECWRDAIGMSAMREVRAMYSVEHVAESELNVHRAVLRKADAIQADRSAA